MALISTNPATGQVLNTYAELTDSEVETILQRAQVASKHHRHSSLLSRVGCMQRLASALTEHQLEYARLITLEMGKTLASAAAEVQKCAVTCRHYAEHAERYLMDISVKTEATNSYVCHLPLGPILGVMPWNFPFWQVFRWAVPAVMAGNVGLLKHASNVSGCALRIEQLFAEAGFTEGTLQTMLLGSRRVAGVIADSRIKAVSLTGSDSAGKAVAAAAGKHVKKCVLELGGSDPFIVMPSADLERATANAVAARIINNGQSCIAAKRFIVHIQCYDDFLARFVEFFNTLRVGDPLDAATDVGPLSTESGRKVVQQQVASAYADGVRLLSGGSCLEGPGYYYKPTVLAEIAPGNAIHHQEVFGPVALVYRVRTIDEALAVANDNPYGLASSVWTQDPAEQRRFIHDLETGLTFINEMVTSDPRLPFGGVKLSGYGRELGAQGMLEFVNSKTVYIR